jgi:hypothetical protein
MIARIITALLKLISKVKTRRLEMSAHGDFFVPRSCRSKAENSFKITRGEYSGRVDSNKIKLLDLTSSALPVSHDTVSRSFPDIVNVKGCTFRLKPGEETRIFNPVEIWPFNYRGIEIEQLA